MIICWFYTNGREYDSYHIRRTLPAVPVKGDSVILKIADNSGQERASRCIVTGVTWHMEQETPFVEIDVKRAGWYTP